MDVSRGHLFDPIPRMWGIERAATGGALLRIGKRRLSIADVSAVAREDLAETDNLGVLVMGIAFIILAAVFDEGVVHYGWRQRFLIGAGLFGTLGVISLVEAWSTWAITFVCLRITTTSGEVVFTTADPADATALETAIVSRQRG